MTSENNNSNKTQILLPPQSSDKKTLVLDLDETLVHSQFMTFSAPSDVIIQIEIENEMHDIHVMVRPGVKEFLEKMEKLYEIVIFTASVSKYADPLLDIIDKKGFCPFRLFREHCSLINTTFVKDLQRLGRDLKNIVIVDNSPLSYALHPENGLPILTWFEDKSDRELYAIMPVLEFLSSVKDVRDFIPKFVGPDNKIDYEKVNEIIKNYNGPRLIISDDKKDEKNKKNNNNNKNNGKEINIEIINNNNNLNDNYIQNKNNNNNNKLNNRDNKENIRDNKNKLVELAMKNIIASVNPNSVEQNNKNNNLNNNPIIKKKSSEKNKIIPNNHKNHKNHNNEQKNKKDKNNIKIDTTNSINVKKISNSNNTAHSTKKFKAAITDGNFKTKQKRKNYSTGGNYIKGGTINLNSDSKSIILKSDNNNLNNVVKAKNTTPKINKTINLLNKSNHTTRSVKFTKKTNTYIIIPTSNNGGINKMSKSLTKNGFSIKNNNINNMNKENIIQNNKNKNNKNINNKYKSFNGGINNNNNNGILNHKKQKSTKDFRPVSDNKNPQINNNSPEKQKKTNKKIEMIKNKNHFLKTGFIQNKMMNNKMNNININLSNNLSLSYKFNNPNNNLNMNNINSFDYTKTNRGHNQIKFTLTNSNILKTNYANNYSPNNRYIKKSLDNNLLNNNRNNQNHYLKHKTTYKNNSAVNDKITINNKHKDNIKVANGNNENNAINGINKMKSARPKSSSIVKPENKVNNNKNHNKVKSKYQSKIKFEINDILQKRGISGKINDLKK